MFSARSDNHQFFMCRPGKPVLLILMILFLNSVAALSGEVTEVEGVRRVHNGAEPLRGERTVNLEQVWRVNVEEAEELIGVISASLAGPDGTVWLSDQQLGQVLVYSVDGELLRTISREGEGPGEVNSPNGLLWLSAGCLGITDRKQGQITQVDAEGIPLSAVHLRNGNDEPMASAQLSRALCSAGTLAVCGTQFRFDDGAPTQSRFFSIFAADGAEVKNLMSAPSGFDCELENFFPAIEAIEAATDGGIRVLNGSDNHGHAEGIARTYDVFDGDGHFQEVVHVACAMNREQDRLERLADGRWILLRNIASALQSMYAGYRNDPDGDVAEDEPEPESLEIICLQAGGE